MKIKRSTFIKILMAPLVAISLLPLIEKKPPIQDVSNRVHYKNWDDKEFDNITVDQLAQRLHENRIARRYSYLEKQDFVSFTHKS